MEEVAEIKKSTHLFSLYIELLSWAGVFNLSPIKFKGALMFHITQFVNCCQVSISNVLELFLKSHLSDIPFKMCITLTILTTMFRQTREVQKSQSLKYILEETDTCMRFCVREEIRLIGNTAEHETNVQRSRYASWMQYMDIITKWLISITLVYTILVFSMAYSKGAHVLLCWYPFDANGGLGFAVIMLAQYLAACTWNIGLYTSNNLLMKLILALCVQFEVIANSLRTLDEKSTEDEIVEDIRLRTREKLRAVVGRHQRLLGILGKVKNWYDPIFFNVFLTASVNICFGVYIFMMTSTRDFRFFSVIFTTIFAISQLSFYCVFGFILSETVSRATNAAYESAWVDGDSSHRRSILIMLIQGSNTFELSAGWFSVSLPSLAQILQDAISYIMVMVAINENETE